MPFDIRIHSNVVLLYIILMLISCFIKLFANELLLAVYFICILDYGKQIQANFLFKFKRSNKAVETTRNINNAFDPGIANEYTAQCWFKKFCKDDENPEDEASSDWPSEVDGNHLRGSLKLILFHLHKKLPKNSTVTTVCSFGIWRKLKGWKSSISGCFMSWLKINIFIILRCLLLFYSTWTISQLDCDVQWTMDFIRQSETTSSLAGCRKSSTALPKPKLAPKKGSWSLFGGLLLVWSMTAFWIPAKPLHLRSMLSKSMRCTQNCNAYSRHWSTERAQFSTTTLDGMLHNQCFKSRMNWAAKFGFICHIHLTSHQLTTTSSSISTTFWRENASTTSKMQKVLSMSSSNPKAWISMLQE